MDTREQLLVKAGQGSKEGDHPLIFSLGVRQAGL